MDVSTRPRNWVATVQRFVRAPKAVEAEYCELCSVQIPPRHSHLVEPAKRRLLCACQGCATLLGDREDRKYRLVPEEVRVLEDFHMTDAEWDALRVPIGLAFFIHSTLEKRVLALYPGPAGPTESLLGLESWSELVANNPVLAGLEPDVEALLVNRVNGAREYYWVPIDRCYALVGLIRAHWKGMSGGDKAWEAIGAFFADLREAPNEAGERRHG